MRRRARPSPNLIMALRMSEMATNAIRAGKGEGLTPATQTQAETQEVQAPRKRLLVTAKKHRNPRGGSSLSSPRT